MKEDPDEPGASGAQASPCEDGEPPAPDPAARAPSAEESLDDALDDLERILDRRGGTPARDTPVALASHAEEHYEIPLLDDIVLPGVGPLSASEHADDLPPTDEIVHVDAAESEELSRLIAGRLASEIEIIVNDGIDRAVREALAEAQSRIKQHLAIVLPELVDEIRQARRRDG